MAISGTCLTVVEIKDVSVRFDVMQESLDKTTLGEVKEGDEVNVERSATFGDEIGGHILSGHVLGMAEIVNIREEDNNHVVTFKVPQEWMQYIFQKGFIALDGASLTVVNPDAKAGTFEVHFIPETLEKTTFGIKRIGDKVNVEIDSRTQTIVEAIKNIGIIENSPLNEHFRKLGGF